MAVYAGVCNVRNNGTDLHKVEDFPHEEVLVPQVGFQSFAQSKYFGEQGGIRQQDRLLKVQSQELREPFDESFSHHVLLVFLVQWTDEDTLQEGETLTL